MGALYDTIGVGYAARRRPDPRIAAPIHAALGDAETVLNVGAGTGSYEPEGRTVTAVDPSEAMIAQRPPSEARVIRGRAEDLPFADDSFDAGMAVLTVHHWDDTAAGLSELRRAVRGPVVLLTHDPAFRDFWLFDYFPDLIALDAGRMPEMSAYGDWLGQVEVSPVPIPHDCTDGFLAANWRRPEAYLDPDVRAAISSFWKIGDIDAGLARLRRDLASGAWRRRYGDLLDVAHRDCGYRLVVSR